MGPQPDPQGVFKHKLKQSFGRFLSPCNDITYLRPVPYTGWDCAHSHARTIGRELGHAAFTLYSELDAHVLAWYRNWSPANNPNTKEFYAHPWIITRDDLPKHLVKP